MRMELEALISKLGRKAVAEACGVRQNAVSNWLARGELPAEHRNTVWQMALDAGIDWTPPGAEGLRDKLRESATPGAAPSARQPPTIPAAAEVVGP